VKTGEDGIMDLLIAGGDQSPAPATLEPKRKTVDKVSKNNIISDIMKEEQREKEEEEEEEEGKGEEERERRRRRERRRGEV